MPVQEKLRPLIAVPTTAGTGSETTGTAIFDYEPLLAKTGIANRALRPSLGIVDSLNTESCPRAVHISSGLDVLFHSLESYTAIPYNERVPRPATVALQVDTQGHRMRGARSAADRRIKAADSLRNRAAKDGGAGAASEEWHGAQRGEHQVLG